MSFFKEATSFSDSSNFCFSSFFSFSWFLMMSSQRLNTRHRASYCFRSLRNSGVYVSFRGERWTVYTSEDANVSIDSSDFYQSICKKMTTRSSTVPTCADLWIKEMVRNVCCTSDFDTTFHCPWRFKSATYHICHFLHLLFLREFGYLVEGEIGYRNDVELEFVATWNL